MEYTVTFNKDSRVCQHVYHSQLSADDFVNLMKAEWMIDSDSDDDITIEVLEPVS